MNEGRTPQDDDDLSAALKETRDKVRALEGKTATKQDLDDAIKALADRLGESLTKAITPKQEPSPQDDDSEFD